MQKEGSKMQKDVKDLRRKCEEMRQRGNAKPAAKDVKDLRLPALSRIRKDSLATSLARKSKATDFISPRTRLLGSTQCKLKRRLAEFGRPKQHNEVKLRTSLLAEAEALSHSGVVPSWKDNVTKTPQRSARGQNSHGFGSSSSRSGPGPLRSNISVLPVVPVVERPEKQWKADVRQACEELGSKKAKKAFAAERKKVEFHQRMAAASSSIGPELPPEALPPEAAPDGRSNPVAASNANLKALGRFQQAFSHKCAPTPLLGRWIEAASRDDDADEEEGLDVRVLQLCGQNITDFVVEMLCDCFTKRVSQLEEVDLGDNTLSERAVKAIGNSASLSKALRHLHLRNNCLGSPGCDAIIWMLKKTPEPGFSTKLQSLDLSQNSLGDAAVSRLCGCLAGDAAPELTELGLAENGFGRDHTTGMAMRRLLATHTKLTALDLYFNFMQGNGAYELLYGVYENNENGSLKRLDISWNQLSVGYSWRIAQMLATILRDGDQLAHMDLSYNNLPAQDMAVIADALSANSTLWGLHLVGNAAAIDADGFVIPVAGLLPDSAEVSKGLEKAATPEDQLGHEVVSGKQFWSSGTSVGPGTSGLQKMGQMPWDAPKIDEDAELVCLPTSRPATSLGTLDENALPSGALSSVTVGQPLKAKEKIEWLNNICMSIPPDFHQKEGLASTNRRTILSTSRSPAFGCCWICESWAEVELRWTPGLSGPWQERISEVWAFLSIDNFAKPVILKFDAEEASWIGYKMLPPSTVPIALIFQVDSQLMTAQNLPARTLSSPVSVKLVPTDETAETSQVNCLILAEWASAKRAGTGQIPSNLVTVTEDPQDQSRLVVAPRNGARKVNQQKKEKPPWSFAQSVWAPQPSDSADLLKGCLTKDWALLSEKLSKVMNEDVAEKLNNFVTANYNTLYSLYMYFAFQGVGQDKDKYPCLRLAEWMRVVQMIFPEGVKRRDTDTIFAQSVFVHIKMADKFNMDSSKKVGLLRYQFIEALIRLAQFQWCKGTTWEGVEQATQTVLDRLSELSSRLLTEVQAWRDDLFCEKCDKVLKKEMRALRTIYEHYRPRYHKADTGKHGLCVTSWMELFLDADAFDETFTSRDASILFGRTLLPNADEYSMDNAFLYDMGFKEFLMNIGAVVKAREHYVPGMMAESIEEFIVDNINPLYEQIYKWQNDPMAQQLPGFDLPCEWLRKLAIELKKVFQMADDDLNGNLSRREFSTAFGGRYMRNKLKEFELEMPALNEEMLDDMFAKLDIDGSGDISFLEALHGLAKMKEQNKNNERVLTVLRSIFEAADSNKDESLSRQEFLATFESLSVQRIIRRNGINFGCEDIVELFDSIDCDGSNTVTVNEVLEGYMKMKNAERSGDRAAGFLQQVFLEADTDKSGTVTKKEFCRYWCLPKIQDKLFRLGLTGGKNWKGDELESYFETLDINNQDGVMDLDELLSGFFRMRDEFRMRTLAEEQDKWEQKVKARASNSKVADKVAKQNRRLQDSVVIETM